MLGYLPIVIVIVTNVILEVDGTKLKYKTMNKNTTQNLSFFFLKTMSKKVTKTGTRNLIDCRYAAC